MDCIRLGGLGRDFMTAKTLAERSASYRQRKAERVARMEAALREIAACGHHEEDRLIAQNALG